MDYQTKWNRKHKERINLLNEPTPNPRLSNLSSYLTGGTALDLACGLGGNSLFLAKRNYEVQALDISDVAIHFIKEKSVQMRLTIHPQVYDIDQSNLLNYQSHSFHLVVMTYYLNRSLFPNVKNMVQKGGYFFMETYFQSSDSKNQGVSNQYKLHPQELLTVFKDWTILFYEENEQEGRQTIFCKNNG